MPDGFICVAKACVQISLYTNEIKVYKEHSEINIISYKII